MTYQQIISALGQKQYKPVYFLHGKEPFYIDAIADYIEEHVLTESEKSFNQVVLYGKEVSHLDVIDHARRYPMMSQHQVVIIKEAQEMKDLQEMEKYLRQPMPTTLLVICYKHKTLPKNSKLAKLLKDQAVVFESKKLYDNQVPEWIQEHLRNRKRKISPATADLLAEYLGTDLSLVSHELDKLILHVPEGTEITTAHVEKHVGISREYNIFELQKAIANRNKAKIARISQNFIANPKRNPFIMVTASLAGFFTKVYMMHFLKNKPDGEVQKALGLRSSYALRDYRGALRHYSLSRTEQIIGILKEYDLKAKGVDYNTTGKQEGSLLKELIWKISH